MQLSILYLSASAIKSTNTDPSEATESKSEWEKTHHINACQLYYPGSTAVRFPVPEEKVPWEVPKCKFIPMNNTKHIIFLSMHL